MKQPILLTALIFSGLVANAQNLTNVQTVAINYTNVSNNNTQQSINYSFSNDINPSYQQFAANNVDIQVQSNNRGRGNSSATQSFGNSGNNTNKQKKTTSNTRVQVQTTVNDDNLNRGSRGNNFEINDNVLDNNVGNENANRGRGGNIVVNDVNINSNPVVNDTKKTVASKPIVQDAPGLDFKPSGLSGRDYSNGGKLKKGQKNFYTPTKSKHKSFHKRKPNHKKVKHHTSKCAKW